VLAERQKVMALSPILFRTQWEAAGDKLNRFSDCSLAVNGPDAILDNNIPADARARFREQVQQIDPALLELASLWRSELESWETGSAA
jgi:hypothetical protein